MGQDRPGGFEELVLLAVRSLDGEGYGVNIQEQLESGTGHVVSVGAVYATLDRLERKGYVSSRLGSPTPERGGRRKRLFRVTSSGVAVLEEMRRIRRRLWRAAELPGTA